MAKKGTTKYISNLHEKYIAERFRGKVQIASGAIQGLKGDCITSYALIECKCTEKASYVLKRKVIEKIEKEALNCCRVPLLAIRIQDKDYILYRLYDLFTAVTGGSITHLNESLTIPKEISSKTIFDVRGTWWGIAELDEFLDMEDL